MTAQITDPADGHEVTKAFATIPPGDDVPFYGKFYDEHQSKRREGGLQVALWFDDANSVSWVRNADGELVEFTV